MDNLQELLGASALSEPPQIKALKNYVLKHYDSTCSVSVGSTGYVLAVTSAPLANTLQLEKRDIETDCNLDKPLRIRIGL